MPRTELTVERWTLRRLPAHTVTRCYCPARWNHLPDCRCLVNLARPRTARRCNTLRCGYTFTIYGPQLRLFPHVTGGLVTFDWRSPLDVGQVTPRYGCGCYYAVTLLVPIYVGYNVYALLVGYFVADGCYVAATLRLLHLHLHICSRFPIRLVLPVDGYVGCYGLTFVPAPRYIRCWLRLICGYWLHTLRLIYRGYWPTLQLFTFGYVVGCGPG